MKKNIIIVALIVISLISILFNIDAVTNNSLSQSDENRTNEAFYKLAILRTPFNLTHATGDSVAFIKSSVIALGEIENDLIEISGGIDPNTGRLKNTRGVNSVNEYFYFDNLIKPFAAQDVDSIINNYIEHYEQLGSETSLKAALNILRSEDGLFRNLTIAEAIQILDSIRNLVSFDERRLTNGC